MDFSLKKFQSYLAVLFIVSTVFLFAPKASLAADVNVYAEGAYTDTDLVVYIYADITTSPILSFGVKVEYPAGLVFTDATKNDAVWYFGDSSPGYPYMEPKNTEPEGANPGSVVIIGGKLDTGAPTAGVSGSRVLLGTVTFKCTGFDFASNPTPISMTYAHGSGAIDDNFKNFVATDGNVLDSADDSGVHFAAKIAERGDANADGIVNFQDMLFIKNYTVNGGNDTPYADCNADLKINFQDMLCVKAKTEG